MLYKKDNGETKIVLHKVLSLYPFSWCSTHASPAPLALISIVSHSTEGYDELAASRVLHQEEYDVGVAAFSFSPQESAWDYFYVFANTLLHFLIGLLAPGYNQIYCILRPLRMLDTISSFLFVKLKPSSRYIAHL